MHSIIERFFNGEHTPSERGPILYEKEYRAECRKAAEVERTLCDSLGEKERQLFEEYKLIGQKSAYLEIMDKFVHGFSLGMMMAAEAYRTAEEY